MRQLYLLAESYDPLRVHLIDAYTGLVQSYAVSAFLDSWATLGNMAVTGRGQITFVELNGLTYPYILQAGEIIRLK